MTTAREIMTSDAECVRGSDTLPDAARTMRHVELGASDDGVRVGELVEGSSPR